MALRRLICGTIASVYLAAMMTPAQAADLTELAREAVFDLCPGLMEIETPLQDEDAIKSRGFAYDGTKEHPRMGRMDVVSLETEGGKIWIGNSRDASACQVGLEGSGAKKAFDTIYENRDMIADDLRADNAETPDLPGMKLVTLRTESIDGMYLGVQFVDLSAAGPDGPLVIQQYVLEEE